MADWNQPSLGSTYTDFLALLKARDEDLAKMLDGTGSNLPTGAVRWNAANSRFEKYDGSAWQLLSSKYNITVQNALTLNGNNGSDWLLKTGDTMTGSLTIDSGSNFRFYKIKRSGSGGDGASLTLSVDGQNGTCFITAKNYDESSEFGRIYIEDNNISFGKFPDKNIIWHEGNVDKFFKNRTSLTSWTSWNDILEPGYYEPGDIGGIDIPDGPVDGNWHNSILVFGDNDFSRTTQMTITDNGMDFWFRQSSWNGTWSSWRKLWHSGNDGSGSGLDADTLDGMQPSDLPISDDTQSALDSKLNISGGTLTGNLEIRKDNPTVVFEDSVNSSFRYVLGSYNDLFLIQKQTNSGTFKANCLVIEGNSQLKGHDDGWYIDNEKILTEADTGGNYICRGKARFYPDENTIEVIFAENCTIEKASGDRRFLITPNTSEDLTQRVINVSGQIDHDIDSSVVDACIFDVSADNFTAGVTKAESGVSHWGYIHFIVF